jgi:hypothetical protein
MTYEELQKAQMAKMERLGLHPFRYPMGDVHHTDVPFSDSDEEYGEVAWYLGGLFIDKEFTSPCYFHYEMTSKDVWTRVARALRIHGLKIVDAND